MKKEEITALFGKFESISCEVEGIECWSARELQPLLGYAKWDNFINNVVVKAKEACRNAGENIEDHFPDVGKVIIVGHGADKSRKTKRDGCEKRNAFIETKTKCASNLIRKVTVYLQNQSKTPSLYIKINGIQMDF